MVTARIYLWGMLAGAVLWNESKEYAVFEFDKKFVSKGLDIAPIIMPLNELQRGNLIYSFPLLPKETYKGLPGLLADSLPDKFGNKLIDAWLARQGRGSGSFNSVERLLYTGRRGMGALEFEPATSESASTENIEVAELVKLAKEVLQDRKQFRTDIKENTEGLAKILSVGTSDGGARAKAIIAYNAKTGEIRSGQVKNPDEYSYWIIKFDGVTNEQLGDPKGYGRIEYAYNKMASDSGIEMPEFRLINEHNRAHFMTKRFDRGPGCKKLHVQTLCALAHFDYNDAGVYSYEQVFQVMRKLRFPYNDAEQMFKRLVFNVVARNNDDHTKNTSFIMDDNGIWRLAPAYDMTYAYNPENYWIRNHQLSVNGKLDGIGKKDLLALAKEMNIKKPNVIIEAIIEVISRWPDYAKNSGIPNKQSAAIGKTHLLKL